MVIMFYQVKVLDRYGKVKKIISRDELRNSHWDRFDDNKKSYLMPKKKNCVAIDNTELSYVGLTGNNNRA
jgi:hypothetical protein